MTLQRYLARLISLCIVPVLALAVGLGYLQFRQARDDDGLEAQRLATTLARDVDRMLEARIAGLRILALSPLAEDAARWPELYREAQGFRMSFGDHVALIDKQMRPHFHTLVRHGDALPALASEATQAAVQAALNLSVPRVSDIYVGKVTHEPSIAVAVPGLRGGEAAFAIMGMLQVSGFQGLLDGLPLPPHWSAVIRDGQGAVIAHRSDAADAAADPADNADVLRFVATPLAAPSWLVEARIPRVTYAQHLDSVASILVLSLLGVTLLGIWAGRRGTKRLTQALRSLVDLAPARPRVDSIDARLHAHDIDEVRDARRLLDDTLAQREAATLALQVREEQLRRIFESASDAIVTADAAQTIVLANPAASQIFGRSVEQLIGTPLESLLPERFRTRHREDVERFGLRESLTRAMAGSRSDVVGLRADGSEFPIEAAISQVHVEGRRLYTVILRDVTERRRSEAAIATGKARLEATLHSMSDALAMVDVDGRIVDVNAAFLRMYGFEGRSDLPRSIDEFAHLLEVTTLDGQPVPPESWSKSRALRGETGSGDEVRLRRKDTGASWVGSFSYGPIRDVAGAVAGAVVTVRDVTERKRMEDELRTSHVDLARLMAAQQQVEEAERKRIARELHDELQQVLAAIKLDVGSLEAELALDPKLDPKHAAPALLARIEDLAGAAITSSRRIVNDLRPVLLEELGLLPALQVLARQFRERTGIEATVEGAAADAGDAAAGDVSDAIGICLYRVAQEALNNVAKHSGASRVRITLTAAPCGGWTLRIADNGHGLAPREQPATASIAPTLLVPTSLAPTSFGLRGMAERVRALGGTLHVSSPPCGGVVIEVRTFASNVPPRAPAPEPAGRRT